MRDELDRLHRRARREQLLIACVVAAAYVLAALAARGWL